MHADKFIILYYPYIGIHEWCVFQVLLNLIAPTLPEGKKLSKFQMVIMFFLKICLSLCDEDIACRFRVHASTVSRNFHRVLDILTIYTTGFIRWPDRETLRLTMPSSFLRFF